MSDWYLQVDPTNAPESCGSFYWDPLMVTSPGDERSALVSDKAYVSVVGRALIGVLIVFVVGLSVAVRRKRCRRSVSAPTRTPQQLAHSTLSIRTHHELTLTMVPARQNEAASSESDPQVVVQATTVPVEK